MRVVRVVVFDVSSTDKIKKMNMEDQGNLGVQVLHTVATPCPPSMNAKVGRRVHFALCVFEGPGYNAQCADRHFLIVRFQAPTLGHVRAQPYPEPNLK